MLNNVYAAKNCTNDMNNKYITIDINRNFIILFTVCRHSATVNNRLWCLWENGKYNIMKSLSSSRFSHINSLSIIKQIIEAPYFSYIFFSNFKWICLFIRTLEWKPVLSFKWPSYLIWILRKFNTKKKDTIAILLI